jgi:alpha-glucosidase
MYFNFATENRLSAVDFRAKIGAIESNSAHGWPTFVLSNHDIPRWINRYGDGKNNLAIAKMVSALMLTLRGTAILYYGEEIGMTNHDPTRLEDVRDVVGKRGWPQEKGRDGERTPMQWNANANAGFNAGAKTWLPANPNYKTINVASESGDPNSLLNWYRQLIALRRENSALYNGDYRALNIHDANTLAYLRQSNGDKILVVLNMSPNKQIVRFDPKDLGTTTGSVLLSSPGQQQSSFDTVELEPNGVMIAELK